MNALNTAITAILKADPVLAALGVTGVYKNAAPQGSQASPVNPPYIIYSKRGGIREHSHDGATVRRLEYQIKAVDKGDSSVKAGNIDEQIGAVLSLEKLSTTAGLYLCIRTGDMPDVDEVSDGIRYQHVGGFYRFIPG